MKEINLGFWNDLRNKIAKHLANEHISTFQGWSEIQSTMIAGANDVEYEYLRIGDRWSIWSEKLKEFKLKPNNHPMYPVTSTNNLHHAYSLQILMEEIGYLLNEFDDIVEFGGGYGNMCRLFKIWNHNKPYYLYDIPELLRIQQYYLSENNIKDNVLFKSGYDKIENIEGNSLFLGLWSISEVPITERAELLDNLGFFRCKNIFLALGGMFLDINNLDWLNNEIIPKLNELEYNCKLIQMRHVPHMYYFIANKKQ